MIRIEALDLSSVVEELTHGTEFGSPWTEAHAEAVKKEYQRYLLLRLKHPELLLVPSTDVDRFWHAHILLDTQKYADDCQAVFGHFLHHRRESRSLNSKEMTLLSDAFATTQELYLQEFGMLPPTANHALCPYPTGDISLGSSEVPLAAQH